MVGGTSILTKGGFFLFNWMKRGQSLSHLWRLLGHPLRGVSASMLTKQWLLASCMLISYWLVVDHATREFFGEGVWVNSSHTPLIADYARSNNPRHAQMLNIRHLLWRFFQPKVHVFLPELKISLLSVDPSYSFILSILCEFGGMAKTWSRGRLKHLVSLRPSIYVCSTRHRYLPSI